MSNNTYEASKVILAAFGISSVGGLAALLRSKKPLTWRNVAAAFLYSGMMGLCIGLLWYNIPFLLGVSGLAGIGGTTVVDFIIQLFRKGGFDVIIRPKPPAVEEEDDQ